MRTRALWCLLIVGMMASAAVASDGTGLSWNFQSTGFTTRNTSGSLGLQTALAMRDGKAWPVIFSYDEQNADSLNAYSLYPVSNSTQQATYPTNWHEIGTGILSYPVGSTVLSAATSVDGKVGAVIRSTNSYSNASGRAIVGSSTSGWGAAINCVSALDFNAQGTPISGSATSFPLTMTSPQSLVDLAVSPKGEVGALDLYGNYYQKLAWTGNWAMQSLRGSYPAEIPYADLAMDSLGRPHIVSLSSEYPGYLSTYDFNPTTGQWASQTLSSMPSKLGATVAADSRGGVGAAWVQNSNGTVKLMYSYKKDAQSGWATHEVTSGVYGTSASELLSMDQRVGLAYDANNFPVISFTSNSGGIWLAYDPPVSVPEPSCIVLLAIGGMLMMAGKSRVRRFLGL